MELPTATVERLRRENEALRRENARLRERLQQLEKQLDELARQGKRQAAPFRREQTVAEPKRPGRKPGHPAAVCAIPREVHEIVPVPLAACTRCGSRAFEDCQTHVQYQIDLPVLTPFVRQFNLQSGYCAACGHFQQARHPLQTSDALGAAGVQLGPNLLGMAADLKHRLAVPYRKICDFLGTYLELTVCPAALCRAEQRLARKASPTYTLLREALRRAGVVHADETGWRVGRCNAWLWVFSSPTVTIYAIRAGRGARSSEVPRAILGEDFDGILIVDGWAAYDVLECRKGRCVGHILRRARDLAQEAAPNDARYLGKLMEILKDAIALAAQRPRLSARLFALAAGVIEERFDAWLTFFGYNPSAALKKLVRHLRAHRAQWFVFLQDPAVPPTNNHGERMLKPALAIRKIGACNKTLQGALVHEVLASLLASCRQQAKRFSDLVVRVLRATEPVAIPLALLDSS